MCSTLIVFVFAQVDFVSPNCTSSWPYIDVNVGTMVSADFATAAFLISFCVVLGVTSPLQLIIMAVMETIIYVVNDIIGREYIGAVDVGCTIFIHLFAACFGLATARVLYKPEHGESEKEGSSYSSDLFSMVTLVMASKIIFHYSQIGTIFLWVFWPSFNACSAAPGDAQQRALINTYLSLCSCVMASFAVSALVTPSKKFSMVILSNTSL